MQEGIYINANIHERDLRYLQCQPTHKSQKNEFLVGGNLCSFVILTNGRRQQMKICIHVNCKNEAVPLWPFCVIWKINNPGMLVE